MLGSLTSKSRGGEPDYLLTPSIDQTKRRIPTFSYFFSRLESFPYEKDETLSNVTVAYIISVKSYQSLFLVHTGQDIYGSQFGPEFLIVASHLSQFPYLRFFFKNLMQAILFDNEVNM